MFQVYMPIAGLSMDVIVLLILGMVGGVLSGLFGIGGGFLISPVLMFMGVPPTVALSTSANQTIAASFSSFLSNLQRDNVDMHMGGVFSVGSVVGSYFGVYIFSILKSMGLIDFVIYLIYFFFLGSIGVLLAFESLRAIYYKRKNIVVVKKDIESFKFLNSLPFKVDFKRSGIRCSIIIPVFLGVFVGVLVALSGIGGGFVLIPSMIYLLGMPTLLAVGTSTYQIVFVTIVVTFLQATNNHTVDLVLSFTLMMGAVFGSQIGIRLSSKVPAEELRSLLALLILTVTLRLAFNLFFEPDNLYNIVLS